MKAADHFSYRDGELWCEQARVADLAERFGTPLYVYSAASMQERFGLLREAWPQAHICYAVKSNSNLAILRLFGELGAGFDTVSGGEIMRLQRAGLSASHAVFAGVGKQEWEVRAALEQKLLFFAVESEFELELFEAAAQPDREIDLALRLNPDVDAQTHEYISTGKRGDKFGMDLETAARVGARIVATPGLKLVGYHVHLGSQLRNPQPYAQAFSVVEQFLDAHPELTEQVKYYDLGGGFGVAYGEPGGPLDVAALAAQLRPAIEARGLVPVLEPGRYLVADAGILLTRVLGTKPAGQRRYAVVDAAMTDLLRPALYSAEHPVGLVRQGSGPAVEYDVVGPVCESGDFLALGRTMPELAAGDLLSVFAAGAYGSAMTSNYNSRMRPAEVLVRGDQVELIRRREQPGDLWAAEVGQ